MKVTIFFIIMIFSSNSFAEPCNLRNLNSPDEIEKAQQCLIKLLSSIDDELKDYENHKREVLGEYKKLISQAGLCRSIEIQIQAAEKAGIEPNPYLAKNKPTYQRCMRFYEQRKDIFHKVAGDFYELDGKVGKLEDIYEALKLEKKSLDANTDNFLN